MTATSPPPLLFFLFYFLLFLLLRLLQFLQKKKKKAGMTFLFNIIKALLMFFSLKYLYLLFKRNWKRGFIMRSKRLKITFWLCLSIKSFQLKPAFLSKENQQRIFRCTLKVSFFCKLFIIYFYILPLFIYLAASVVFISIFKQLKLNANFFQNFAFFPHSSSLPSLFPPSFILTFLHFFYSGYFILI